MKFRQIGGCFVAGTLVHTSDGLVPIERIRVGDLVLSRSGAGDGGEIYQRVVSTFEVDDKEVWYVGFYRQGATGYVFDDAAGFVVCTPTHRFRVVDMEDWAIGMLGDYRNRWVPADRLNVGMVVQLAHGQRAEIVRAERLLRTSREAVGFMRYSFEGESEDVGFIVDLIDPSPTAYPKKGLGSIRDDLVSNDIPGWKYMEDVDLALARKVYDLQVEASHTYYVDRLGAWVQSSVAGAEDDRPVGGTGPNLLTG